MSSAKKPEAVKSVIIRHTDEMTECAFREFRDQELSPDYWGMSTSTLRTVIGNKVVVKQPADYVWVDEQTQPLPRSVRQFLHGWVRAEELAAERWGQVETVIFEDNGSGKISIMDMQVSHTQVLQRSSFCRRVLSACYILERLETMTVEHQWENFSITLPEGWRAKYHIYSPGIKPGGGAQHRPAVSKNGCYLVRLYYLGAWRCVWVNDQVPVDAMGAPLLPFSPLLSPVPSKPAVPGKQPPPTVTVTSSVVHLWPLLLCKALLKLAAPDMNCDEDTDDFEDEQMPDFKILHSLTGAMEVGIWTLGAEDLWERLVTEVPAFYWDDDDDTLTTKSKNVKKSTTKETTVVKRAAIAILTINDTKDMPPYTLPGISPGHEMGLYVSMVRDLPLKKPLPEPDVELWKQYRWVDWARRHGLYEAYDCPRTRFLKMTGFMKLSYAPHLLDVQSTETITVEFRRINVHDNQQDKKAVSKDPPSNSATVLQKEELREWALFDNVLDVVKQLTILYFPSMYEFTTTGNAPPVKITKSPLNRALDIVAPKSTPLYLQIDGPDKISLKISLNMLHPRVMMNCGTPVLDYIESAYLILECFNWFKDTKLPRAKAYLSTRGYDTVEVDFLPGRHYCRLWVHSRLNWHVALLSEASLLLGYRDLIQCASVLECPWAARFLSKLGTAFSNLLRVSKSTTNFNADVEFYKSYQPDLPWDPEVVGYKKELLHWMFRQALQSLLIKRLSLVEFREVCNVLRRFLLAPDFGLPEKQPSIRSYKITDDLCDCTVPEPEISEDSPETGDMQVQAEEPPRQISLSILNQLLPSSTQRNFSQICELANDELPCEVLKEERDKVIRKNKAATLLQAHWRGFRVRKCLTGKVTVSPEVLKCLMESACGSPEALSALMNEFFLMYPGAKSAYSVASALTGTTGLQQFSGTVPISPQCKWIPYFQGVFYCHDRVKVHFAIHGTLQFHTVAVYDNDTGLALPQVFRAHITFDIKPNNYGYTVMGHGSLAKPLGINSEAHWQLTVLSSIADVFHVCDNNDGEYCREIPLPAATKMHTDEIFIPNRRNIIGGFKFYVTQHEAISFRAAASSTDLNLIATLLTQSEDGGMVVVDQCASNGELFWPYIKLDPVMSPLLKKKSLSASGSHSNMSVMQTAKTTKPRAVSAGGKKSSSLKVKDVKGTPSFQPKLYVIQVMCPDGWPLTLEQWQRVEEIGNTIVPLQIEPAAKKAPTAKISARDKTPVAPEMNLAIKPQPGDAYAELECSLTLGGGTKATRDDDRELEFQAARRQWDANEPGRNLRGALIRQEFREEFLEVPPPPPVESIPSIREEALVEEENAAETKKEDQPTQVRPTPVTESGMLETSIESEEEEKYLSQPEQLKDKFIPLPFLSFCMKEDLEEERVVMTPEMAEAAKSDRSLRLEAAMRRMEELQEYNNVHVLGQQRNRSTLLEKLFVDGSWTPELYDVLEEIDKAIAQESLTTTLAATKKKIDQKKK